MKLTLTVGEAEVMLQKNLIEDGRHFDSIKIKTESCFEQTDKKPNFDLIELVQIVRSFNYKTNQKIPAIKAVRQFGHDAGVEIGLAAAKWFVENI